MYAVEPKLDEIWTSTTGDLGVISDIRGTTIVFLSLTGNRASVAWRDSLKDLGWKKVDQVPDEGGGKCLCLGCERRAFLVYDRDGQSELTCAYHAPRGAHLRVTSLPRESTPRVWSQCESCKHDGYEVLSELQQVQHPTTQSRLWACRFCNKQWVLTTVPPTQTLTTLTSVLSVPCGYQLDGEFKEEAVNPITLEKTYRMPLKNDGPRLLSGSRPKTFLDHLNEKTRF